MKKVLYLSNIEVPYRVRFFNELAKCCDLTVFYESRHSQCRDAAWAKREIRQFRTFWFPQDFLRICRETYDVVIIGCYQNPLQILLRLVFRLRKIPCILNLDGEPFLEDTGWKGFCKRVLLSGGAAYLTAGEKAAESVKAVVGNAVIRPYYFSSLLRAECLDGRENNARRTDTVLVVGQYFPYKGMDVALEAARLDPHRKYRFVGMGKRTGKFLREQDVPENVEIIPFLPEEELKQQYQSCALLVLPSRRECWGLVITEAAAFGTPVVSTWDSGAAVEFLAETYPQYLAVPGNAQSLQSCIQRFFASEDRVAYGANLQEKAMQYNIERSVQEHRELLEDEEKWCL